MLKIMLAQYLPKPTPASLSLVHGFTHDKSVPHLFSTPQPRSQQQTEIFVHLLKKLAPVKEISGVLSLVDPMRIFSPLIWEELQLQDSCACANKISKQQYLWTWCQSVVPNDAPRDFDPEVAFGAKFQMPVARQGGRERNIVPQAIRDRSLSSPQHIYRYAHTRIRSCRNTISLVLFHMVRAGAYWHKIHDIHECAFAVHTKQSVISFLFRRLLSRHYKTFNVNAEKPKFKKKKA